MSSLKKKADIFHKGFNSLRCKTSLKLAASRLKLLRNKREAQVKMLKREVAQLLGSGQEESARVKVEHVIREEKAMSAYELIELYCEIIAARLQIVESQKDCPIDLKEAVSSVIFAQARCADLPELKDVRKNLTRKYGKDFADAAAELRPGSGVSSLIVEKLSAKSPSIEVKIKALTTIATEHDIDWKPKLIEQQLQKPKEEGFLDGPSTFQPATKLTMELAKPVVPQAAQQHVSVLNPIQPQPPSTRGDSSSSLEQKRKETESEYVQSEEQRATFHQQYWNTNFKDAAAAAEAAAKSAEMANLAAKAAADLALHGHVPRPQVSVSDEYNQPPSEVFLKSQQSEPIILKPIRSDMRTDSTYKENSRIEGQHGGAVRDGQKREPEKEYYDNSRSSGIKPMPTSSSLKDGDEPVVMSGKADVAFHKKISFDQVTVKPYQVNEKIERNDDIEYDRTDTYYRSPRSEDQQGQRIPRDKPVEETKNYKQIKNDRKTSTHLENLSDDRQGPGNTKRTPSEELANDFKAFQSEGSFRSSAASQPETNVFNDMRNPRRATSSVASPDLVVDNAMGAARLEESFVTIAPQNSEHATVRRNSEKEQIAVHDYDEKSYSRTSSRDSSSSFKSAFDESSSSFQDSTHDRYRVETWKEHVATEENTNDFLSRSDSPRSKKHVYNNDWYPYNERQDSLKYSFSSEEVVAQSYRKDDGPDVRGEDVKGKDSTFYSASGTTPFEDEVASQQSEDPHEFISEFGADGRWQTVDRQGSSSCLPKPDFDDSDSDDGHRINLDKIPSDDETEPMRNQSGIFLSQASPVQPVLLESEYIKKSMSMETHEKDITPVVFDNYDDYDRDSDSGNIESTTKRTSLKDRSLSTISAKSSSSHETDREVQLREKEGKPSDMLSRDSSSRGLENRSSGRKKWDLPTRTKQPTHQYTRDEANFLENSEVVTAERMEMESNSEVSESGMGLRLGGGLRGGMRNNRTLPDPPYFSYPVGDKSLSSKETSDTNRSDQNVEEPAKHKTSLISEQSSRARSIENVSVSDESFDGGSSLQHWERDNAGVSLQPKHLSEAIKVKQVGYNRPETLMTDEGSPQRLARRSQIDESEDYHTPTLSRRNRRHAKNLDESTTTVEETSGTAFYAPSNSERSFGNEMLPSSRSKGGLRSSASSYNAPISEEVDPQPWRSSVGGSWRTKQPSTESSRGEFPGKESSDQGLLSTDKNRRGGRVINSASESEEEVDCQTERPAARGSRRTRVSSKVSAKEELLSKDNSDKKLLSRGKNETGYGRSTFHAEMDGEDETDNRRWSQTSRHTLSGRELSDRSSLPRESNESVLRSSLLSNDVDVDRIMDSRPHPSEKLTSRRTNVLTEESLGQKFPGQTDQRKARERSEQGYGRSIPSRDPELDDEINTSPQPSVLEEGDKFSSRRTRVPADERSRKETLEQEMDQNHRAVGRSREKEASRRTGLTWGSKTSIEEKDLDDNDALEVKTKPRSKLSSFSSAEKRSTPIPGSTVSGPERENAKSPTHHFSSSTVSKELEIKESLTSSSSAAEQRSTIKVDRKLTETKATEQSPTPTTRDSKNKEPSSAPLANADLSPSTSSDGKDTSSEKKAPAHVHPKLPSDFDSFVANFQSLRANTRKK